MNIQTFGDQAIILQFSSEIDPEAHQQVIAYLKHLQEKAVSGINYLIPAYGSLTIGYNPERISFEALTALLEGYQHNVDKTEPFAGTRRWKIPVCYDPPFAPDLEQVAAHTGLSVEEIINQHSKTRYRVYMIGFLPGFPYLGILPKSLATPRRKSPRLHVQAGSVGIAQRQTGIYPNEAPGGWQIIGRTPIPMYTRTDQSFLLQAGDEVQFECITGEEFNYWSARVGSEDFSLSELHG